MWYGVVYRVWAIAAWANTCGDGVSSVGSVGEGFWMKTMWVKTVEMKTVWVKSKTSWVKSRTHISRRPRKRLQHLPQHISLLLRQFVMNLMGADADGRCDVSVSGCVVGCVCSGVAAGEV